MLCRKRSIQLSQIITLHHHSHSIVPSTFKGHYHNANVLSFGHFKECNYRFQAYMRESHAHQNMEEKQRLNCVFIN
jgi:hypothetical protein